MRQAQRWDLGMPEVIVLNIALHLPLAFGGEELPAYSHVVKEQCNHARAMPACAATRLFHSSPGLGKLRVEPSRLSAWTASPTSNPHHHFLHHSHLVHRRHKNILSLPDDSAAILSVSWARRR